MLIDSECPVTTGTRAQVAEIRIASSVAPRILRVSRITLRSSVV